MMSYILIPAIGLILTALLAGSYYLAVRAGKRMKAAMTETYGDQLKLVSGCGVISGYNRVPGVMGLLDDRIVFQAMITGEKGNIFFHQVRSWLMEDTRTSRFRRARKYRSAKVLSLETEDGDTRLLILSEKTSTQWERLLTHSLGAPHHPQI